MEKEQREKEERDVELGFATPLTKEQKEEKKKVRLAAIGMSSLSAFSTVADSGQVGEDFV